MQRLKRILLREEVQTILDTLCACFDIHTIFYSPEGDILKVGRNLPDARYCLLLQKHIFGEEACLSLDARMRREAAECRKMLCYKCHTGLHEAIHPIYIHDRLAGHVMIGQFRSVDKMPDEVRRAWQRNWPMEQLEQAFEDIPYIPPEKIQDIHRLFATLIDYIVSQNLVRLRGNELVEEAMSFIRANLHRPLSLAEVARHIHRSQSTVSHTFKAQTGKAFKQVLIEMKLDRAEELMRDNSGLTVSEIARLVGYEDAFHFSSLYSKHRHYPPSEYLKKQRSQ
jgi:AraC-like DNA-binding protein